MSSTENKPLDVDEILTLVEYELGFTAEDAPGTPEQDWIDYLKALQKLTLDYIDSRA